MCLKVSAPDLAKPRPTAVEPVNAILSTSGEFTSASPTDPPGPVTVL